MVRRSPMWLMAVTGLSASLALSIPAGGKTVELSSARQLLRLASGETAEIGGLSYSAQTSTIALVSTSSELVTIAVISGQLAQGTAVASGGQALVTPIEGHDTQRFGFDAARLAASLPPQWQGDAAEPLRQLAARQKRSKFWGLIEPAGVNASAPTGPQMETVRQSYLGNNTIIALRRAAQGQPKALAGLTVKRFAEALAAGDAATVADLIDPKPFTDTGTDPAAWQAARLAFAQRLTGDAALKAAMAAPAQAATDKSGGFDAGGAFRIQLVTRDRAMFVTAVEPLS